MKKIKIVVIAWMSLFCMYSVSMQQDSLLGEDNVRRKKEWNEYYSLIRVVGPDIDKKYQEEERKINIDKWAKKVCQRIDTNITIKDCFKASDSCLLIENLSDVDLVHMAKKIDRLVPLIPQENKLIKAIRSKEELRGGLINMIFNVLVRKRVVELQRVEGLSLNSVLNQKDSCFYNLPPLFARRIKYEAKQQIKEAFSRGSCYALAESKCAFSMIKFSPDNLKLACANDKVVTIYYIKTGDKEAFLIHQKKVSALCWRENNKDFAVSAGSQIFIWDTKTGQCKQVIDVSGVMDCLEYIPNSSMIMSENGVWNFETGIFIKDNHFVVDHPSGWMELDVTSDEKYTAKITDWGKKVVIEGKCTFLFSLIDIACKNSKNFQEQEALLGYVDNLIIVEKEKLKVIQQLMQEKCNCVDKDYIKILDEKIKKKSNQLKYILFLNTIRETILNKINAEANPSFLKTVYENILDILPFFESVSSLFSS